ncbi:hypothetical protein MPTK2_3g17670 [Marchantia polymorpha subsp. ruderalis]
MDDAVDERNLGRSSWTGLGIQPYGCYRKAIGLHITFHSQHDLLFTCNS